MPAVPTCTLDRATMESRAPDLCSAAADAIEHFRGLADCTLVGVDGSRYEVSKGYIAVHSRVLGCAGMLRDVCGACGCGCRADCVEGE